MRILICLSYYYPNVSGLSLYGKTLAEELVKRGHRVTVLTSRHKKNLPEEDSINGVRVVRLPVLFSFGKAPVMPSLFSKAVELIASSDIVNCHLPQAESFYISLVAKILKKPLVITYHTDLDFEKTFYSTIYKNVISLIHALPLRFAKIVITSSSDYADTSPVLRKIRNKLSFIHPPIISRKTKQEDSSRALLQKLPQKNFLIGVIGRLAHEKGIEYILGAIPFLETIFGENFSILFVGPKDPIGEKKYMRQLAPLIKRYFERIYFTNTVTDEELGALYSILDVVVMPSVNRTESFGMVQVEAMFLGIPVVASDLPGIRVPIQKTGMGLLAKANDSEDLARKITEVVRDKEKFKSKKPLVEKYFSLKESIDFYENIFEK